MFVLSSLSLLFSSFSFYLSFFLSVICFLFFSFLLLLFLVKYCSLIIEEGGNANALVERHAISIIQTPCHCLCKHENNIVPNRRNCTFLPSCSFDDMSESSPKPIPCAW